MEKIGTAGMLVQKKKKKRSMIRFFSALLLCKMHFIAMFVCWFVFKCCALQPPFIAEHYLSLHQTLARSPTPPSK